MSAELFVAEARKLKGARWRHRGRKPWAVDCLGLIALAAKGAGLEVQDETRYGREPWDNALQAGLRKRFGEPVTDRRPGDIALIRWRKDEPSHVGIIADHPHGLSIIHAHNVRGVVEHRLEGSQVSDCIVEVYRPWPVKSSR